jgi:hypothetical protein
MVTPGTAKAGDGEQPSRQEADAMTRQSPAPPTVAPAEARYFRLMAIGPDDEPEASAPPSDPVSELPRFSLMAIGTLDEEPVGLELCHYGRKGSTKILVTASSKGGRQAASRLDRVTTG